MIIEKIRSMPGWWQASTRVNGEFFCATSNDKGVYGAKLDALKRLFAQLQWAEIGNWNKNNG